MSWHTPLLTGSVLSRSLDFIECAEETVMFLRRGLVGGLVQFLRPLIELRFVNYFRLLNESVLTFRPTGPKRLKRLDAAVA